MSTEALRSGEIWVLLALLPLPLFPPVTLAGHDYWNARRYGASVVEDGHDGAGVGDVIERIGGQHDQVGALARAQGSPFGLDPQQFCVISGGAYDGLHRREPCLYHVFQFAML